MVTCLESVNAELNSCVDSIVNYSHMLSTLQGFVMPIKWKYHIPDICSLFTSRPLDTTTCFD